MIRVPTKTTRSLLFLLLIIISLTCYHVQGKVSPFYKLTHDVTTINNDFENYKSKVSFDETRRQLTELYFQKVNKNQEYQEQQRNKQNMNNNEKIQPNFDYGMNEDEEYNHFRRSTRHRFLGSAGGTRGRTDGQSYAEYYEKYYDDAYYYYYGDDDDDGNDDYYYYSSSSSSSSKSSKEYKSGKSHKSDKSSKSSKGKGSSHSKPKPKPSPPPVHPEPVKTSYPTPAPYDEHPPAQKDYIRFVMVREEAGTPVPGNFGIADTLALNGQIYYWEGVGEKYMSTKPSGSFVALCTGVTQYDDLLCTYEIILRVEEKDDSSTGVGALIASGPNYDEENLKIVTGTEYDFAKYKGGTLVTVEDPVEPYLYATLYLI